MIDILRGLLQNPEDKEANLRKESLKGEINKLLVEVRDMDSLTNSWIPRDIKVPKKRRDWGSLFPILKTSMLAFFAEGVEPQYMQARGWPFSLHIRHSFVGDKKIDINYEDVGLSIVRAQSGNLSLSEWDKMTRLQIVRESLLVVRDDFREKLRAQVIGELDYSVR